MDEGGAIMSYLVQRAYRDFADIVRYVFPGGALRVAGGHTLSVPQVTLIEKHPHQPSRKKYIPGTLNRAHYVIHL